MASFGHRNYRHGCSWLQEMVVILNPHSCRVPVGGIQSYDRAIRFYNGVNRIHSGSHNQHEEMER